MQFTWAQFNKTVASVPPNQNRKLGSLPLGALKPLYLQNGLIRPFSAYIYVRDAQPAVPIVGDAAPVAFNANSEPDRSKLSRQRNSPSLTCS